MTKKLKLKSFVACCHKIDKERVFGGSNILAETCDWTESYYSFKIWPPIKTQRNKENDKVGLRR